MKIPNLRKRRCVSPCEGAFSLLEVLIASLILAILAIPLFSSLQTGQQGTERIIEDSMASSLGSTLLEKLAQVPYGHLPLISDEKPDSELGPLFNPKAYAPIIEPYPAEYRRLVTIETVSRRTDDPGDAENATWGNLKLIRVKVEWRPDYLQGKTLRTLIFQTLVTDDTEAW